MYCPKCGKVINDDAFICPHCHNYLKEEPKPNIETNTISKDTDEPYFGIGVCSIFLAFLMPVVGLVLSILTILKAKVKSNKTMGKVGLFLSIFMLILYIVILIVTFIILIQTIEYTRYQFN